MSEINQQNPHNSGQVFPIGTAKASTFGSILPDHINMNSAKIAENQLKSGNGFLVSRDTSGTSITREQDFSERGPFEAFWTRNGVGVSLGNLFGGAGDGLRKANLLSASYIPSAPQTAMCGTKYLISGAVGDNGAAVTSSNDPNSSYVVFAQAKEMANDMMVFMDFTDTDSPTLRYDTVANAVKKKAVIVPIAQVPKTGNIIQICSGDIFSPYSANFYTTHPFKVSFIPGSTGVFRIEEGSLYCYKGMIDSTVAGGGVPPYEEVVAIGETLNAIATSSPSAPYPGYLLNENGYTFNTSSLGETLNKVIYLKFTRDITNGGEGSHPFKPVNTDSDKNTTDTDGNVYPESEIKWRCTIEIDSGKLYTAVGTRSMIGWTPSGNQADNFTITPPISTTYTTYDPLPPFSEANPETLVLTTEKQRKVVSFWQGGELWYPICRLYSTPINDSGGHQIGVKYNTRQILRSDFFFMAPMDAYFTMLVDRIVSIRLRGDTTLPEETTI